MMDQFPSFGGHASLPLSAYWRSGQVVQQWGRGRRDRRLYLARPICSQRAAEKERDSDSLHRHRSRQQGRSATRPPSTSRSTARLPATNRTPRRCKTTFTRSTRSSSAVRPAARCPTLRSQRLRAERKSILDLVSHDLDRFGVRAGTGARSKIDAHLTSIRNIEKQLDVVGPATAVAPPKDDPSVDLFSKQQYDKITKVAESTWSFLCVRFQPHAGGDHAVVERSQQQLGLLLVG